MFQAAPTLDPILQPAGSRPESVCDSAMIGIYGRLIDTVFLSARWGTEHRVVALTSALPREGVSYITQSLAQTLAELTSQRTLLIPASALRRLSPAENLCDCYETSTPNLWKVTSPDAAEFEPSDRNQADTGAWWSKIQDRQDCIRALRHSFDYVILDCPSLKKSWEATFVAPVVDGVMLVINAGSTRRDQIERARRILEQSRGKVLGFVLNRRTYPIPKFLYDRL